MANHLCIKNKFRNNEIILTNLHKIYQQLFFYVFFKKIILKTIDLNHKFIQYC